MWTKSPNYQSLSLKNVRVDLRIGAFFNERDAAQPVEVDVTLYRQNSGYRGEGLDGCLDYSRIYDYLTEAWPKRNHQDLLEQWAEDLVQFCLADSKVEACMIRLRKPEIYSGSAFPEIEVFRSRN